MPSVSYTHLDVYKRQPVGIDDKADPDSDQGHGDNQPYQVLNPPMTVRMPLIRFLA